MSIDFGINISLVETYFVSNIFQAQYRSIKKALHDSFKGDSIGIEKAIVINEEVFKLLSQIDIKNLIVRLTPANSILYRFAIANKVEIKFEVFLDYDGEDPQDIQSIIHLYKNDNKVASHFGSIDEMFNKIISENAIADSPAKPITYYKIVGEINNKDIPQSYLSEQISSEEELSLNF